LLKHLKQLRTGRGRVIASMASLCGVVSKEFLLRKCRNITSIMQVFLLTANAMIVAALGKIDIIGYGNGDYHLTMIL
jgi:hypothetical protein